LAIGQRVYRIASSLTLLQSIFHHLFILHVQPFNLIVSDDNIAHA